jgi:zinc protease
MSERKKPRLALFALIAVALIGSAAFYFSKTGETSASEALDKAKASQKLQSLTELNGKAPSHRTLDVQTWNTAEGAKVLFVEARELPMFDMRLIFAAGSSQDGNTPGLALLTNAMLNEGVAGKDVSAIAQGFEY